MPLKDDWKAVPELNFVGALEATSVCLDRVGVEESAEIGAVEVTEEEIWNAGLGEPSGELKGEGVTALVDARFATDATRLLLRSFCSW